MKNAAVNLIAPMNIIVLGLFLTFWQTKSLKGVTIHRTFFIYYTLYLGVNLWHLLGRLFFPETLTAKYKFSAYASNGVFILIVGTMWLLAVLKFLDNNSNGGLMGVYERNIGKWRKWF